MKRRLFGLVWSLLPPLVAADELKITIADIPEASGTIMISVMGSLDQFKDDSPPTASVIVPAQTPKVSLTLHDLPAGEYAVRVMHDRNTNQKLDTNLVGMPREPWGFSNNAVGKFGPPGWSDMVFTVAGSSEITINLNQ
jgi:uncharacterized protein (DUF2141 family)